MKKAKFTIPGKPVPQKRHRMGRGFSYDPSAPDKKRVRTELILANRQKYIHKGDVSMFITFHMQRPKSHYRTGKFKEFLKKGSPYKHTSKPDIDNLVKFVMDSLSGINGFFLDDNQIVSVYADKIYSDKPRTEIIIIDVDEEKNWNKYKWILWCRYINQSYSNQEYNYTSILGRIKIYQAAIQAANENSL